MFCKHLYPIGVTAEVISQKEKEIFNPQDTAMNRQIDGSKIDNKSKMPAVNILNSLSILIEEYTNGQ